MEIVIDDWSTLIQERLVHNTKSLEFRFSQLLQQ